MQSERFVQSWRNTFCFLSLITFLLLSYPSQSIPTLEEDNAFFHKCAFYAENAYIQPDDLEGRIDENAIGTIYLTSNNGGDAVKEGYAGRIYYDPVSVTCRNKLFIALRGSHSTRDWLMDFYADLRHHDQDCDTPYKLCQQTRYANRSVHRGFDELAEKVVDGLRRRLKRPLRWHDGSPPRDEQNNPIKDFEFVFCGHSLAGALSLISSAYFKASFAVNREENPLVNPPMGNDNNAVKVVTFSAPHTGSINNTSIINQYVGRDNIVNFYNSTDIVVSSTGIMLTNPGHHIRLPFFSHLSSKASRYYKIYSILGRNAPAIILCTSYAMDVLIPLAPRLLYQSQPIDPLGICGENFTCGANFWEWEHNETPSFIRGFLPTPPEVLYSWIGYAGGFLPTPETTYSYSRHLFSVMLALGSTSTTGRVLRVADTLSKFSKGLFDYPLWSNIVKTGELFLNFHSIPAPNIINKATQNYAPRQQKLKQQ